MKNKDKIIGSLAILVVFILFLVFGFINKEKKQYSDKDIFVESSKDVKENKVEQKESKTIKVQIKGAVKMPGVYTLESGARVEDLIKLAGGITEEADTDKLVSQAKKLKDEECIIVPKKSSNIEQNGVSERETVTASSSTAKNELSASVNKVNINTATKEELMSVPGIGEVTATNIIEYREKNGDFKSLQELKNINRIGEKTLEKLKDKLEVN